MFAQKLLAKLSGKKVFPRGIHPHDAKSATRDRAIEAMAVPAEVIIPMQQHIGAPAQSTVKNRQAVTVGEVIGTSGGFVSSPVHASVKGTVGLATTCLTPIGRRVSAVPIAVEAVDEATLRQQLQEFLALPANGREVASIEPAEILSAVHDAGLVGMGGATFPTHVKFKVGPDKKVDTVIVNGSECEPYLTADDRLMREASALIVRGLQMAMRVVGASRGLIAIEDNKPEAIAAMQKASANAKGVEVAVCLATYPMGGEKQLVPAVTGRVIPTGGLPLDVGVLVVNVATTVATVHAVDRKVPLTHRVVTVTGAVNRPGNYFIAIGTPISFVLEQAGGLRSDAAEVLLGGPMMGVTMPELNIPVTKGTSGITVLAKSQVSKGQSSPCVRCGRCVDHCPLNLTPTKIAHAVIRRDLDLAEEYDLMACCECGCCSFGCPSGIPLVQYMKSGKAAVMKKRAEERAKQQASAAK